MASLIVSLALMSGSQGTPERLAGEGRQSAAAPNDQGIELQMLNQQGEPAAGAYVEVHASRTDSPLWSGATDVYGRASIAVPDGAWVLVVSSAQDHFVVVREDVVAPGSLSLDTTGTVPVNAVVRVPDGQSHNYARVSFERFNGVNDVGYADVDGQLRVDLSPGTYCGLAQGNGSPPYHLERRGITVTVPMTVTFDAARMETGQVAVHLAEPASSMASIFVMSSCRRWTAPLQVPHGEPLVVAVGCYELVPVLDVRDAHDDWWEFHYSIPGTPHDISAGSVMDLFLGGPHVATVNPSGSEGYSPGDRVSIESQIVDSDVNRLQGIYGGPPGRSSLAHIVVRGPQDGFLYEGDCDWRWSGGCGFDLSGDAPHGCYDVAWSLGTGPLQGTLQARTQFMVGGGPTCTVVPTATSTPSATATRVLRLNLPLLLKAP